MELKIGLNNMQSKTRGIHANCGCRCPNICYQVGALDVGDCCTSQVSFTRLTNLWSCILCPKPEGVNGISGSVLWVNVACAKFKF